MTPNRETSLIRALVREQMAAAHAALTDALARHDRVDGELEQLAEQWEGPAPLVVQLEQLVTATLDHATEPLTVGELAKRTLRETGTSDAALVRVALVRMVERGTVHVTGSGRSARYSTRPPAKPKRRGRR